MDDIIDCAVVMVRHVAVGVFVEKVSTVWTVIKQFTCHCQNHLRRIRITLPPVLSYLKSQGLKALAEIKLNKFVNTEFETQVQIKFNHF